MELGTLSKLEELVLVTCRYFARAPDDFINQIPEGIFLGMAKLRTLDLCVASVSILPADLWNLNKLEHLRIKSSEPLPYHAKILAEYPSQPEDVGLSCIQCLKRLSKCLRVVEMRRWPIFKSVDFGSALEAMSELFELTIDGCPLDEIIISKSTRFSKLNSFSIKECPRLKKLEVGGDALNGVSSLTITMCASLRHFVGLEHLQCLKHLNISAFPVLEGEFIKPNEGIGCSPIMCLPSLESLILHNLPQLRMICGDSVSFPCLSELFISYCHKLKKFPRGLMNEKRPLRGHIAGKKEWWKQLQWQDDFKCYLLPLYS